MATFDWYDCSLVEVIPGNVSGAPLLKNTRLPVDAITGNYGAFRDDGLSPDEAIAETLDCSPEAGLDNIKAILDYRAEHEKSRFLDAVDRGEKALLHGEYLSHERMGQRLERFLRP